MCVVLVTQSCLTLCDPMNHTPPGSSTYGILQAKILKLVAISYSKMTGWEKIFENYVTYRGIVSKIYTQFI